MNMKGLILAGVGGFLIYMAVKGTFRDVWKALAPKGASNGGQ